MTVPHPLVVVSWSHLMQASRSLLTNVSRSQKENENDKEIERRTPTHTHTHTHTHTSIEKDTTELELKKTELKDLLTQEVSGLRGV